MFESLNLQPIKETTADGKIKNSGIKTGQAVFEGYLKKDERIDPRTFSDIYSAEEINTDLARVETFKKSLDFQKPAEVVKSAEVAIVLENMFCDLVEKHEWFGEGVKVVQLSEFDDMDARGTHCDVVLEIPMKEDDYIMRIGVDLTSALNYDTLNKKRTKCIEGIQSGRLFSAKYFESKAEESKGRLSGIPVFFAGIDEKTIRSLCDLVAKQQNTEIDFLGKHEVQFMFLEELVSQVNRYVAIALAKHGSGATVTMDLGYYKDSLESILNNKKAPRPNGYGQKALQDDVYRYITKFV